MSQRLGLPISFSCSGWQLILGAGGKVVAVALGVLGCLVQVELLFLLE